MWPRVWNQVPIICANTAKDTRYGPINAMLSRQDLVKALGYNSINSDPWFSSSPHTTCPFSVRPRPRLHNEIHSIFKGRHNDIKLLAMPLKIIALCDQWWNLVSVSWCAPFLVIQSRSLSGFIFVYFIATNTIVEKVPPTYFWQLRRHFQISVLQRCCCNSDIKGHQFSQIL